MAQVTLWGFTGSEGWPGKVHADPGGAGMTICGHLTSGEGWELLQDAGSTDSVTCQTCLRMLEMEEDL